MPTDPRTSASNVQKMPDPYRKTDDAALSLAERRQLASAWSSLAKGRDNLYRLLAERDATIEQLESRLAATEAVAKELQNSAFRVVSNRHNADLGHSHLKLAVDDLAQVLDRLNEPSEQ